jgi:hypothetical protein
VGAVPATHVACYFHRTVTKPILDVAKHLADAHRQEDPATTEIFLAEDTAEVRLVEVSESVAGFGRGPAVPLRAPPRSGRSVPVSRRAAQPPTNGSASNAAISHCRPAGVRRRG